MLYVSLHNSGGQLCSEPARTEEEAAIVAAKMITETGSLRDGDRIVIEGYEEDAD